MANPDAPASVGKCAHLRTGGERDRTDDVRFDSNDVSHHDGPMSVEVLGWATLAERLGLALAAGAVIGWDRARAGKPAGVRTHMVVSLGSCLFVLAPLAGGASVEAVSRAIQGVATGVGFLGAGEILHYFRTDEHRAKVRGLTSAAALWSTSALGVAAALGVWRLIVLSLAATVVVLTVAKPLERRFEPRKRPQAREEDRDRERGQAHEQPLEEAKPR
jgi:putative Mg2+ transporter-C (MgtC) family protein